MAHTYTKLLIHALFSTKERLPLLNAERRNELFPYMRGILENLGTKQVCINGPKDHVPLLFLLPPRLSLADVMEKLKANSSKWIRQSQPGARAFSWQAGYAAFSVSQSNAGGVRQYIARQEEHHHQLTYQEEVLSLLKKHGIDYDPRFVLS